MYARHAALPPPPWAPCGWPRRTPPDWGTAMWAASTCCWGWPARSTAPPPGPCESSGADSRSLRSAICPAGGHRRARPVPPPGPDPQVLPGHPAGSGGLPPPGAARRSTRSTCCWVCFRTVSAPPAACMAELRGGSGPALPGTGSLSGGRGTPHPLRPTPGAGAQHRYPPAGPVRPGLDPDGCRRTAGPGDRPGGGTGPG